MIYHLTLDVQESKIPIIEEMLRSMSFVKDIKPLVLAKERIKPNRFSAMKIKTKDFKFNREEANER
ncbi:MAG: hypothetical protein LBH25_15155 [Fibromonadaceae bacterium]|jgi:hypothetical protein|nr:hypothetical protein [Fibromonadaceae bacterium]